MGACNGQSGRNSGGLVLLGSQVGQGSRAAGPNLTPLPEAEGAGVPPVAMETARASSGNPWQPGCCQEEELWKTGQPFTHFLGRASLELRIVGERPIPAGEGGPGAGAPPPRIPKVRRPMTSMSPTRLPQECGEPLHLGGRRVTTSLSWALALPLLHLLLLS